MRLSKRRGTKSWLGDGASRNARGRADPTSPSHQYTPATPPHHSIPPHPQLTPSSYPIPPQCRAPLLPAKGVALIPLPPHTSPTPIHTRPAPHPLCLQRRAPLLPA